METQRKDMEDRVFDKIIEIESLRKNISLKDSKIKDIQFKLDIMKQAEEVGNHHDELAELVEGNLEFG